MLSFIKGFFIFCFMLGLFMGFIYMIRALYANSKAGLAKVEKKKEAHGHKWEDTCAQAIEKYMKVPAIRNVLIPARNKIGSTECDIVFVNNKGVFCTECKYKENVRSSMCSVDDTYLTLWDLHDNPIEQKEDEERPLNPISQNKNHIKWLKEILPFENVPVFNYIRTNYNTDIRYMGKVRKSDVTTPIDLLRSEELLFIGHAEYLAKAMINLPDILTDEEVTTVRQAIEFYKATDEEMAEFKEKQRSTDY